MPNLDTIPDSFGAWRLLYDSLNEADELFLVARRRARAYSEDEVAAIMAYVRAVVWATQKATGMNLCDLLGGDWADEFQALRHEPWG